MDNKIVIDHLSKFENFREEIGAFLETIGLDDGIEIPHLNGSARTQPYSNFYDAGTRREVAKRFEKDILLFGYEFGECPAASP